MDDQCLGASRHKHLGAAGSKVGPPSQEDQEARSIEGPDPGDASDAHLVVLRVEGMGCVNCAARVRNALLTLDGVVSADVDWERGLAIVDYLPTKTDVDALVRAVAGASDDGRHIYRAETFSRNCMEEA